MAITIEEVERIAKLARLTFTAEEKIKLQQELSKILDYVGQIKQVQANEAEDLVDPDSINRMRDDFAEPLTPPEQLLKSAPGREAGYFKVKSVLE